MDTLRSRLDCVLLKQGYTEVQIALNMSCHCDNLFVCSGLAVSSSSYAACWLFCVSMFFNPYFAYCPSYGTHILWQQCTITPAAKQFIATLCLCVCSVLPSLLRRRHWTAMWGHIQGWSPTAASSVARASYRRPSYGLISFTTLVSHGQFASDLILNVGRDKQEVLQPTSHKFCPTAALTDSIYINFKILWGVLQHLLYGDLRKGECCGWMVSAVLCTVVVPY
jgi:hypothetical protein